MRNCSDSRLKSVGLAISGFSDSDYLQMTGRSDSHYLQMNLQMNLQSWRSGLHSNAAGSHYLQMKRHQFKSLSDVIDTGTPKVIEFSTAYIRA